MIWNRPRFVLIAKKLVALMWIVGFAIPITVPVAYGEESVPSSTAKKPSAVLLDVKPLPDVADSKTPKDTPGPQVADGSELRLLGPLESDPEPKPQAVSGPVLLKPILVDDSNTLTAPKPKPVPEAYVPEDEPRLSAPRFEVPPVSQPAMPAARYWIVSSRCCSQKRHKCGMSCRFVCQRVTDDCQIHPAIPEEMNASLIPGAPTCIFVHGSYTDIADVADDAEHTYRWLRCACPNAPLNFVYFTWPSEGQCSIFPTNPFLTPVPCVDMAILGKRAETNGFYLADLIGCLPPDSPVCLVGHSLGTRTIASGLHLLGGGTIGGQTRWNRADCGHRIRAVFAAAAIEHDWLNPGERYGCALQRTECLLNLRSEKDLALFLFPLRKPFSSRSLARAGFTRKDRRELGGHNGQVAEFNVTPWLKHRHGWPNYVKHPEIAAAVAPYVYFDHFGAMPVGAVGVTQSEMIDEYVPGR